MLRSSLYEVRASCYTSYLQWRLKKRPAAIAADSVGTVTDNSVQERPRQLARQAGL